MATVDELDLPAFDTGDETLSGQRFHDVLRSLAAQSWIARAPVGYVTLDRDAGEFFLRMKGATFPGQMIAELFGVGPGDLREEIDNNILHIDGDRHRRLRSVLNPFFTPRAADRWRPAMRSIIADIAGPVVASGAAEAIREIARPYPSQVITTVMGTARDDWPRLHEWSHWMQSQFDGPALLNDRDQIERAVTEFYEWSDALISGRRQSGAGDDLITVLLAAQQKDDRLSDTELRNLVLDVIAGGVDTTHAQLGHALRLFALHPAQWALLAKHPELASQAVEEVLRHEPVTPFTARILTEPATYRDVEFAAGTVLLIASAAGNREGLDPAGFDISAERSSARLMTFGAGIHFCVGAKLARAELEEALLYLAPRMPGLRLAGDAEFGTVQGIYGLRALPLEWDQG